MQYLSVLVIAVPHDSQNGMVYLLGLIDVTFNDNRNDGMWEKSYSLLMYLSLKIGCSVHTIIGLTTKNDTLAEVKN